MGKISIKPNEEYMWNYNNYFINNKFIKSYDALDWIVIGPSKFTSHSIFSRNKHKSSYELCEGDFIKFGKLVFIVRKINTNLNENLNETKRNSSYDNSEINLGNNINEEIIIYNKNSNENYNYINTNNDLITQRKKEIENDDNKIKNKEIIDTVNNKLKSIFLKLKDVNKKQKIYKCRICFCEGNFEGIDPLISPCKCSGSVKYIHLNCLRKWLTSKIITKESSSNDLYCYAFKTLKCEICQSIIPEIVEFRGKFISLLDFKNLDSPYIILQSIPQTNTQNKLLADVNIIFVMSFKIKKNLIIGRSNNSDIRLNDVSVSRNHAKIRYDEGSFYLDDIGSKFGTLILIQNNILFLPYKDISIQTGKSHLIFNLNRTCLGLFKCYKNILYENQAYLDKFLNSDKKVYSQILETFNNNVVDPIEKFSEITGSCTPSNKTDNNNKEENKNDNINLNLNNGSEKNNININENDINNLDYLDKLPIINININNDIKEGNLNINNFLKKNTLLVKGDLKQNESRDVLFSEANNYNNDNKTINFGKNKKIFSSSNLVKFLNNNIIKRTTSAMNINKKLGTNSIVSPINKKKIDLANTLREISNNIHNSEEQK